MNEENTQNVHRIGATVYFNGTRLDCSHKGKPSVTGAQRAEAMLSAAPELLAQLEQTRIALIGLAQEAEARAGVPKAIIGGARHHAEQARVAIAKAKGVQS